MASEHWLEALTRLAKDCLLPRFLQFQRDCADGMPSSLESGGGLNGYDPFVSR